MSPLLTRNHSNILYSFPIIWLLSLFLLAGGCAKKTELHPVRSKTPKASADASAHRTSNGVKTIQNFKVLQEEVTAVGIALPDKAIENLKKRKKNSYKKAKKMAQAELSNILKGLTLMDGRMLKNKLSEDAKLMRKFEKLLKKAEELEVNWTSGEGCSLKLRMNKKILEKKLAVNFR